MEFVFEKIFVPNNHSFISRKLPLSSNARIHSHKNFELNYITSGTGRRIVGDNISGFESGDLVLLGPNLPHCWEVLDREKGEDPTCIVTHFSEDIINSDFFKMPELEKVVDILKQANRGIRFKVNGDREIRQILEEMSECEGLEYYIGLLRVFNYLIKIEERDKLSNPIDQSSVFSKNIEKSTKSTNTFFRTSRKVLSLKKHLPC